MTIFPRPIPAWLVLDDYAGRSLQRVDLVGETRSRVLIRALARTRLAGPRRTREAGELVLVPRHAIRIASVGATTRGEVGR